MNLKNPDLDLIRRIHPECGFYGFKISFWICLKIRKVRFWIWKTRFPQSMDAPLFPLLFCSRCCPCSPVPSASLFPFPFFSSSPLFPPVPPFPLVPLVPLFPLFPGSSCSPLFSLFLTPCSPVLPVPPDQIRSDEKLDYLFTACLEDTQNVAVILRSKFEFSFVATIHFLQKLWGEVDKISSKFILCDHVHNSLDRSVLQSIDITRRNLMLITLRA